MSKQEVTQDIFGVVLDNPTTMSLVVTHDPESGSCIATIMIQGKIPPELSESLGEALKAEEG